MPCEHRLHPSSLLFQLASQVRALAIPVLVLLVGAGNVQFGWQVWLVVLLVPYTGFALARYVSFRYRYEPHEMVIRTGIFFRNERHVPYARIQNVDAVQNVLHRMLGVVEVRVQTAGGQEPEATLSVLPVAAYEEMRRRVAEGRGLAAPEGAGVEGARAGAAAGPAGRTLLALPPRELVLHGIIENRGLVVVAAAFGLVWELGLGDSLAAWAFGEATTGRDVLRHAARSVFGTAALAVHRVVLLAGAFGALLLVTRVLSMAWALLRLYGFRLSRVGDDLRVSFGLVTRVIATIPLRRIQTLTVRDTPLSRLFGRASVRVETAGGQAGEGHSAQREWLAPILRREAVPRLLAEIVPGVAMEEVEWHRAPPRAFRRAIKPPAALACAIAIGLVPLLHWWSLAVLPMLLGWAYLDARLTVARLGWAVAEGAVLFRSGWVRRQVSVARFTKIQAVSLHESPFDRRHGMARVRVDTAGAGGTSHRVDIPYLPRETARALRETLARRAAETAFQW
jgi:putative membrane protein